MQPKLPANTVDVQCFSIVEVGTGWFGSKGKYIFLINVLPFYQSNNQSNLINGSGV